MLWQWIVLAAFAVTLLPAGVVLLAGRVPQRLRPRRAPMRPCGLVFLAFYAAAPLNVIPRLSNASPPITLGATVLAVVVTLAGCVVVIIAAQRTRPTR